MSDRAYKQSYDGGDWKFWVPLIIAFLMFSFPNLAEGKYPLKIVNCSSPIDCRGE